MNRRLVLTWILGFAGCVFFIEATDAAVTVNGVGYSATDDVAYDWIDIRTTGTRILANDYYVDYSTPSSPIGFDFSFYGQTKSSVLITPYGLLDFAQYPTPDAIDPEIRANLPYTYSPFSYNAVSEPVVAPYWTNLTTLKDQASTDAVYYQTIGTPGSRKMVIQWQDVAEYGNTTGDTGTFEAILEEGTNRIKFQYQDMQFGNANFDNGKNATVGVQGTTWSTARALQWSHQTASLQDNYAIQFTPTVAAIPGPVSLNAVTTSYTDIISATADGQGRDWTWQSVTSTNPAGGYAQASVEVFQLQWEPGGGPGNPGHEVWRSVGTRMTNISDSVSTQTVNAWTVQKQLNCSFQSNGPMVSGCSNSGSGEERYTSTGTMSIGSSSEIPVGSPITVVLKTTQDSGGPQPRGSLKVWSTDVDCPLAIIPISSGRVEFTARAGDALNYQFQYLNSFFCTNTSLTMSSNVNLTMTLAPGYSLGSFFAPGSAGWMQPGVWASNVYPHNTGDVAYFGNSIGANATVTLDGNRTLGGLSFNNTEGRSYTIAQGTGGTLTISSSSNSFSMISVSGDGSHTITAPLALNNSSLAVNITTDASMEVSGPLSGWADVTKNGGGTLILSGTNSHTGSWTISSGTLAVDLDGSISPTKILTNNAVFRILGHSVTTGRIEGTGTTEVLNGTLTTPSILQDTLIIGAEDSATAVPEPSAWLMIFTVGMGVAIFFRKHLS